MLDLDLTRSLVIILALASAGRALGQAPSGMPVTLDSPKLTEEPMPEGPKPEVTPKRKAGDWVALEYVPGRPIAQGEAVARPFPAIYRISKVEADPTHLRLEGVEDGWVDEGRVIDPRAKLKEVASQARSSPHDARLLRDRGLAALLAGGYPEAIADFTAILRDDPHDAEAYYHRGLASDLSNDHQRALGDLFEAIRLDPDRLDFYRARARVAASSDLHQRVIADATTVLQAEPGDIDMILLRGKANNGSLRYASAAGDFKLVISYEPANVDAITGYKEAKEGLDQIKALEKYEAGIDELRAKLTLMAGRFDGQSTFSDSSTSSGPLSGPRMESIPAPSGGSSPPGMPLGAGATSEADLRKRLALLYEKRSRILQQAGLREAAIRDRSEASRLNPAARTRSDLDRSVEDIVKGQR